MSNMQNKNNKENILQCALELFSSRGFENVGVQELVNAAGISKPTLYYYFGNKEGLFKEVLRENYERLDTMLLLASVYTPNPHSYFADVYPVLLSIFEAYADFSQQNLLFYRMMLGMQYLPQDSACATLAAPYHNRQYAIVEEMFENFARTHKNMRGKAKRYAWNFIGLINSNIGLNLSRTQTVVSDQILTGQLGQFDGNTAKDSIHQYMHGIFS